MSKEQPRNSENTSDSPPHSESKGVNPAGLGPGQPRQVDAERTETQQPGKPGDRTKDTEGGGI
jgi:hypothetical protein